MNSVVFFVVPDQGDCDLTNMDFFFLTLWEQFQKKSKENLTSKCDGKSSGWNCWGLWRLELSGAEALFFAGWCCKWVKDDNSSRREMPSPTLLSESAGIWDPVMLWNMSAMQMSSFYYLHVFLDWHLTSFCILRTPALSLDREVSVCRLEYSTLWSQQIKVQLPAVNNVIN